MVDHILHCLKAVILLQLIFALFGIVWILHSSIRKVLLSWHETFVRSKRKKAWRIAPLCLFLDHMEREKWQAFENFRKADEALKKSLVYIIYGNELVYIGVDSLSMLDFIEWMSFI